MWKCPTCGKTVKKIPESHKCPCGLFIASESTLEKYRILEEICTINDYDLIVESCAGSGIIGYQNRLIPGSPVKLGQIARRRGSKCTFIESDYNSYDLLQSNLKKCGLWDPSFQFIYGDCNEYIPKIVDGYSPTLVFIDPFGYGNPPIGREMVVELSKKENVDLLFNFFWRICRQMGYARDYLNSSVPRHCSTAQSFKTSLDIYWGHSDWIHWKNWRHRRYAEKYAEGLGNNEAQIIGLPRHLREAKYFLVFSTNQHRLRLGLDRFP